jgi:hypothetical protein
MARVCLCLPIAVGKKENPRHPIAELLSRDE